MKICIIFLVTLLSFKVFSTPAEDARKLTLTNRMKALGIKFGNYGSVEGLEPFMEKCGYIHRNPALWVKEVYKISNPSFIACLESKKGEVDQIMIDYNSMKAKEVLFKNYDCSTITEPYSKLSCELRK